MKELNIIQTKLNVRKGNKNTFGGYSYRSAEDIYEALKPLLAETKCTYIIQNSIELIGDRYYIKAEGTLTNEKGESVSATSYAREGEPQRGMCEAQNSGSTISYVNKYVTSALFLLHNGEADPDATQGRDDKKTPVAEKKAETSQEKKEIIKKTADALKVEDNNKSIDEVLTMLKNIQSSDELNGIWVAYNRKFTGEDKAKLVEAVKSSEYNPNRKK